MSRDEKYVGKGKTTIGMEREQTTSEYEKAIQYIDQLIQQGDLQIGSSLTTQHVKGVICRPLVGMISNYLYNITSIVNGIFPFCRNLLLCMSQRTAKERNEK